MSRYDVIDEALKPAERKVYHDWHDDGLLILDLLLSKRPEYQAAIAKLYADCPHRYSIDMTNGQRVPVRPHQVAAWAGKIPAIVHRLKAKNLISAVPA